MLSDISYNRIVRMSIHAEDKHEIAVQGFGTIPEIQYIKQ